MLLCLVNHRSHTELNIVVMSLVLLLQEINAFSSKKQLHPLKEYGEPTGSDNLVGRSHKDDKMVDANFFDNNGNDQMQKDLKGRGQLEGRQQNRLDRSVHETMVNNADSNKESVINGFKMANNYLSREARRMAFWQQGPLAKRREFLRAVPRKEFRPMGLAPTRNGRLQQYYGYNTPRRFYNMDIQRKSARPHIVNPGRVYRNFRYAADEDLYPSETFHGDHNTNSAIFKGDRSAESLLSQARKQRKHFTYRLVPITATEAKNLRTHKRQQTPLETCKPGSDTPTAKPNSQGEGEDVSDEVGLEFKLNSTQKVNQTTATTKVDKGSAQYQIIAKPPTINTGGKNVADEGTKKNILKEIISELEEFKPHSTSNTTSIRDNMPCSIFGSWISEAGGVRFDIAKLSGNGMLNVTVASTIPPKKDAWLNECQWEIDGEIPLTDKGVFTLTAIHKTQHLLATFVGQCMRCYGDDLVVGVWTTGRSARDCRDTIVSYGEKPDVFHKEVLHILRAQKRKELELRVNQTTTAKPSPDRTKKSSKDWWEY